MFKFKASKNQQSNTEIAKSIEDYFSFSRVATLGFPYKPTALSWDPDLCLIAIGTHYGAIRIYGAPGVQFCGELRQKLCIIDLIFIPKKARLICLCSDNSVHLWELNEKNGCWCLEEIKSYVLAGLMKKITSILLSWDANILYLGTMCGNIYTLNVNTFEMAESVIYQDVIVQNIPDDKKLKQGAVKVISTNPSNNDCLLIGYQQGLVALWDVHNLLVINTFINTQSLESISWQNNGMRFMSSHSDGSYVIWNVEDSSKPAEVPMTPYGPFACKSIDKIIWKSNKGGDEYIIFSGGMPRSSFGDRFALTIMSGDRHQVLDLSSRVIDFFTLSDVFDQSEVCHPRALVILLEEELLSLDLESESWPLFRLPYLEIPHASPVTCFQYILDVHRDTWKLIKGLAAHRNTTEYSANEWPIQGGEALGSLGRNLLLTGHENGCIRLWQAAPTSLQLLYSFQTAELFVTYDGDEDTDTLTDEWPPFRKVGCFDSLLDDVRFAIRSLLFNDITKTLIVGGAAGQIVVLQLQDSESEKETIVSHVTVGSDSSLWLHPQPLIVRHGRRRYEKGLHVQSIVQLTPSVPVTTLAFHAEWNLVAAGITHGFILYDIIQKKSLLTRYTMNMSESSSVLTNVSPKKSSFRRSFRESFRKLKITKSKSSKKESTGSLSSDPQEDASISSSSKRNSFASSPDPTLAGSVSPSFEGESRSTTANNSVQCLYFAQSFIINNVITTPTLWVGTSSGCIYIYTIALPAHDCRTTDPVTAQLGKEVLLKHQAPVLNIRIVDHRGYPLPDPTDVHHQRVRPADLCGSHRVVVATEEQIKVFTLPGMKPYCKNKITLTEGHYLSEVGFASFPSKNDSKSNEHCVLCLSRSNGISLYSIPELKKVISYNYCSADDVDFSCKTLFLSSGVVVCLSCPSEFEIISLSTLLTHKPVCRIELPNRNQHNIVLQMQSISNGLQSDRNHLHSENVSLDTQSEISRETDNRCLSSASSRSIDNASMFTDDQNNSALVNSVHPSADVDTRQEQRAPLAIIDELNLSDSFEFPTRRINCEPSR